MRIVIETTDHCDQRYDTLGDYWVDPDGTIQMRVSRMTPASERAVVIHEAFELLACLSVGVSLKAIDRFDMRWRSRAGIAEPGEDPRAPYFLQHQHAMAVERQFAAVIALPWCQHERNCADAEKMGRGMRKVRRHA